MKGKSKMHYPVFICNTEGAKMLNEAIKKDMNKYKAGDFLYALGDKGIKKESQRVFIYTGHTTADGYGILIGFDSDGKLRKSTGYANFQYGGDVRLAEEKEIQSFISEVFNYQDPIREYGR